MSDAPTFIDFFAGIGGFRVGLEAAGWRCAWAVEMDAFCSKVYEARFGHAPAGGMIQDVESKAIPAADLWCGGFPCQGLSVAGKRGGLDDPRSGLFWEWMRLVDSSRPPWLLIENVPGLLSSNGGEDFGLVLAALEHLGYRYAWRVLDARYFGVAQRRRRLFIVGHLDGEHPPTLFLEPEGGEGNTEKGGQKGEDVAYALRANPSHSGDKGDGGVNTTLLVAPTLQGSGAGTSRPGGPKLGAEDEYLILSDGADKLEKQQQPCDRGSDALACSVIGSAQQGRRHAIPTEVAGTLQHKGGKPTGNEAGTLICPPAHPGRVREAPGLPGRVDLSMPGFDGRPACTCPDSARYRALGNAVAVPFFLKQLGSDPHDTHIEPTEPPSWATIRPLKDGHGRKKRSGADALLDGHLHHEWPLVAQEEIKCQDSMG